MNLLKWQRVALALNELGNQAHFQEIFNHMNESGYHGINYQQFRGIIVSNRIFERDGDIVRLIT